MHYFQTPFWRLKRYHRFCETRKYSVHAKVTVTKTVITVITFHTDCFCSKIYLEVMNSEHIQTTCNAMIRRCVRTLRLQDEIVHQPFVLTKVKLHEIQLSATKLTQNLHIVVGRTYFVIKIYKHHCYLLREREMFILRTERKRERRHFLTVLQLVIHNLYPC